MNNSLFATWKRHHIDSGWVLSAPHMDTAKLEQLCNAVPVYQFKCSQTVWLGLCTFVLISVVNVMNVSYLWLCLLSLVVLDVCMLIVDFVSDEFCIVCCTGLKEIMWRNVTEMWLSSKIKVFLKRTRKKYAARLKVWKSKEVCKKQELHMQRVMIRWGFTSSRSTEEKQMAVKSITTCTRTNGSQVSTWH